MSNGAAEPTEPAWARFLPHGATLVLVLGGAVMARRFGAPALVLWLAFAALCGAVLLFWEALRTALDPEALGDASPSELLAQQDAALHAQKRAALRALKDLAFEHSIQRLSDDDYKELQERYRAEARAAMEALDRGLGSYLSRAEALADELAPTSDNAKSDASDTSAKASDASDTSAKEPPEAVREEPASEAATMPAVERAEPAAKAATAAAETARPSDATAPAGRACGSCETRNDADATFCKRCGARLEAA